eukprot:TRINITY_DN1237_c0_g1_i4.p1 TRINITY_DN1237_c0_g1~~TRINITY_DN1237_c0_g1_i4.p1  ORF type:complete len:179 (-),score=53.45 TRINITY_DN1237_c0_g1_i4:117-653(-)
MGLNFRAIGAFLIVSFVVIISIVCSSTTEEGWFKKDTDYGDLKQGTLKGSFAGSDPEDLPDEFEDEGKTALAFSILALIFGATSLISLGLRMFNKGPDVLGLVAPLSLLVASALLLIGSLIYLIKVENDYDEIYGWETIIGQPDPDYAPILGIIGGVVGIGGSGLLFLIRASLSYESV